MHKQYAEIANRPLYNYHKDVIDWVIQKIDGGCVCDLGSHALGHYWALGYIERVESYSCYDLSQEALDIFRKTIDKLNPSDVGQQYAPMLDYLYEKNVVKAQPEEIGRQLVAKLHTVKQFDFLKDQADEQYDFVLAVESLEVVDRYEDLLTSLHTAHSFLKDGGILLTVCGEYENETADVIEMQKYTIEGKLNPDLDTFMKAQREAGFYVLESKYIPIDYPDYLGVFFTKAKKIHES